MSIWTRISVALAALTAGEGLSAVFDRLRSPPERSVAFTIAVIALGAKMAKADGQVTRDEVTAFREVFHIAAQDEAEEYARRIRSMFKGQPDTLRDLLEGLFHIAMADGFFHPNENAFLEEVNRIFGVPEAEFTALRMRFAPDAPQDPYTVLGVSPDMPLAEIRKAFRKLVRENHPDAMIARGVPEEALMMAQKRMADINKAWEEIENKGV